MDIFFTIAERKIREAVERGDLDDLTLKGQPIRTEDYSGVPEELRMGYKVLHNAGMLPPEMQLKKEILALKDLIACCHDESERKAMKKRLTEKMLRFDILMEKNFRKPVFIEYEQRMREKLDL